MKTTMIGAYPKPPYLDIPDWFQKGKHANIVEETTRILGTTETTISEDTVNKAIEEVILEQKEFGISVVTDGELRRENYIYALCRCLQGIDFEHLTEKEVRTGAYTRQCPTIISKILARPNIFQSDEWERSNKIAKKHEVTLKFTLPGPMTVCDSLANKHYEDEKALCTDIAHVLRREVLHLHELGCTQIQIDEPLFARKPEMALAWGIDLLDQIVEGIDGIFFTVHICCGYPKYLDQTDYKKAPPSSYDILADRLEMSKIDAISIEDAHCHQDLAFLKKFKRTTIVLGVISIAKSRVETVEEIQSRIQEALRYIDQDRLIIAPDCGLGFLSRDILRDKLRNMVEAVQYFEVGF